MNKFINAILDLDPESTERLKNLEGKAVNIELLPFHFKFHCKIHENKLVMASGVATDAETSICGTPLQMMGVMLDKKNRQRFFADDIRMEGNAELGQQVIDLFDQLEIDWEEFLSHFIGDVSAHHTGRMVRNVGSWLSKLTTSFTDNINEYVHEEKTWFPTREAVHDFFNDIDLLRMDVDRAEARVNHLLNTYNVEDSQ